MPPHILAQHWAADLPTLQLTADKGARMSEEIWALALADRPGAALLCHLESGEIIQANAAAHELLRTTKQGNESRLTRIKAESGQ